MKKVFTLLLLALLAVPIYAQSHNDDLKISDGTAITPVNYTLTPHLVEIPAISPDYEIWHYDYGVNELKNEILEHQKMLERYTDQQRELIFILLSDEWNELPLNTRKKVGKQVFERLIKLE